MKSYIGIDLGGTNIQGALVTENGEILRKLAVPTCAEEGAEAVTERIADMILRLAAGQAVSGVGLGCPGTVDDAAGTVVYACNLGWTQYAIRAALARRTGFSVRLVNDANAAALAESLVGAAKGAESAVILTLGTGVGGGIVLHGRLWTGYGGAAGEPGHMVIVADGEPCACGRRGCLEAYASAAALIRMTKAAMRQHPESLLAKIAAENGIVDGRTVFLAQEAGDPIGEAVVRSYTHTLAIGVANLVNIFFPEVVALGGGISNQGETLLQPLRKEIAQMEYGAAYTRQHPRIVRCVLGNDAGIIGAALFAKTENCHTVSPL